MGYGHLLVQARVADTCGKVRGWRVNPEVPGTQQRSCVHLQHHRESIPANGAAPLPGCRRHKVCCRPAAQLAQYAPDLSCAWDTSPLHPRSLCE